MRRARDACRRTALRQAAVEPAGDQQGTEFAAVQGDGMGLVVHSWPAHVRGRRGAGDFFFDRVLAGPGDGG